MADQFQERANSAQHKFLVEQLAQIHGELAYRDELTGLYNYRLLTHFFETWWKDLLSADFRLSLIMIDLDGFKVVNDTYGHLTGDEVLKSIAQILVRHFRQDDIVIRYGGDEFVVVLPDASAMEAAEICERARTAISGHKFFSEREGIDVEVPISFSIGVSSYPEDGHTGEQLLYRADHRLYEEKGRRRARLARVGKGFHLSRSAVVILMLAVLTALIIFTIMISTRRSEVDPASRPGAQRTIPIVDPDWATREAELIAEIDKLQQQLAELATSSNLGTNQQDHALQQQIAALKNEITRLQDELQAQGAPVATEKLVPVAPLPRTTPTIAIQHIQDSKPGPDRSNFKQSTPKVDETEFRPATDTEPVLKIKPQPRYPEIAKKFRKEAVIDLRVLVDPSGTVIKVDSVGEPVGYGLDEEARRAAIRAKYYPGTRSGKAIAMVTTFTIQFTLEKLEVEPTPGT